MSNDLAREDSYKIGEKVYIIRDNYLRCAEVESVTLRHDGIIYEVIARDEHNDKFMQGWRLDASDLAKTKEEAVSKAIDKLRSML